MKRHRIERPLAAEEGWCQRPGDTPHAYQDGGSRTPRGAEDSWKPALPPAGGQGQAVRAGAAGPDAPPSCPRPPWAAGVETQQRAAGKGCGPRLVAQVLMTAEQPPSAWDVL